MCTRFKQETLSKTKPKSNCLIYLNVCIICKIIIYFGYFHAMVAIKVAMFSNKCDDRAVITSEYLIFGHFRRVMSASLEQKSSGGCFLLSRTLDETVYPNIPIQQMCTHS